MRAEDFCRQILAAAAALQDHPPGPQPGDSVFFSGGEVFYLNRIGADSCWPSLARPEEPPQGGEVGNDQPESSEEEERQMEAEDQGALDSVWSIYGGQVEA